MRETNSRRYCDTRIVSSDEASFFPGETESHLESYIWLDKWAHKTRSREIIWGSPGFPWIFHRIECKRKLAHTYIFRKHLYPFICSSARKVSDSRCDSTIQSRATAFPVCMTGPCIYFSIECTIESSCMIESDIESFESDEFYIAETATSHIRS